MESGVRSQKPGEKKICRYGFRLIILTPDSWILSPAFHPACILSACPLSGNDGVRLGSALLGVFPAPRNAIDATPRRACRQAAGAIWMQSQARGKKSIALSRVATTNSAAHGCSNGCAPSNARGAPNRAALPVPSAKPDWPALPANVVTSPLGVIFRTVKLSLSTT